MFPTFIHCYLVHFPVILSAVDILGSKCLNPLVHLYLKRLSRVPLTLSLLPFTKLGRFLGSHPDTEHTGLLPLQTPFLHLSMVGPERVNPGLQRNSPLKKFPASPSSASTTPLSSCGGWHCPDLARLWYTCPLRHRRTDCRKAFIVHKENGTLVSVQLLPTGCTSLITQRHSPECC